MSAGLQITGWPAHDYAISSLLFGPDETSIYSLGSDGKVNYLYNSICHVTLILWIWDNYMFLLAPPCYSFVNIFFRDLSNDKLHSDIWMELAQSRSNSLVEKLQQVLLSSWSLCLNGSFDAWHLRLYSVYTLRKSVPLVHVVLLPQN